ncbi:MAG: IS1634 family transposase [Chloroflexota bacterium]
MPKAPTGAMHVARTKTTVRGKVYESVLVRQSYRVGQQVKHRTLASLTHLPAHVIKAVERAVHGEPLSGSGAGLTIQQSWPHGHVAATLGTARQLDMEAVLDPRPSRQRDLVLAMVVARVLEPASKLATSQLWDTTSLARTLGVERADENDLYAALDWLVERQEAIEQRLAERHLQPGGIVLYDLSSTYVEGEHCELAKRGYSRDGKPGQPQIEFGLITNADGEPVAIEAYPGNTADPATFQDQVSKVKDRFGVADVIWVGDRGMITGTQVAQLQQVSGVSWVTALRAPTIQQLVEAGSVQLSLLDTQNLAEVTDERYPGERLVLCFNPLLAEERTKRREDMLQATEKELAKVAAMVERGVAGGRAGLRGEAVIGERLGRVVNKYQMAKHFRRTITDSSFSYERNEASIAREAQLDGFYVLRTNVASERLDTAGVVLAYKSLAHVERAFRHFKLSDLEVRPIYHYRERRVRAHLLLCMLAYWLQRTMERKLAPLLFMDEAPPERPDPVAPAPRSDAARLKEQRKRTEDGLPVQRFRVLLRRLSTVAKNRVLPERAEPTAAFDLLTQPSPLQQRAFELLGVSLLAK